MRITQDRWEDLKTYAENIKRNQEHIGEAVRLFREGLGITRNAMCNISGVNYATIRKIELEGRATTTTLFDLADAFECDIAIQFVPRVEVINVKAELSRLDADGDPLEEWEDDLSDST